MLNVALLYCPDRPDVCEWYRKRRLRGISQHLRLCYHVGLKSRDICPLPSMLSSICDVH